MAIHIGDLSGLKMLSATLHDASFTREDANFDATAHVFTLKCWVYVSRKFGGSVEAEFEHNRIGTENKAASQGTSFWFSLCQRLVKRTQAEHCWKACFVTFNSVKQCNIIVKEKVEHYELSNLRLLKNGSVLELMCHYGIEINLAVERLDIILSQSEETRDSLD